MDPTNLAVLVPMLGRPHRVTPVITSLADTAPGARVLFCVSPHDSSVRKMVEAVGAEHIVVPFLPRGDYARKVNRAVEATTQPLLFFAADDLLFHDGWFEAACRQLTDGIGVVGTNDLGNPRVMRGEHSTHSLVTRDYIVNHGLIDKPGVALFDGYVHEYVDDELVETARHRGAFAFAADSHVEHLHPHWGKGPMDKSYSRQQARMRQSRPLFDQRRQLWT